MTLLDRLTAIFRDVFDKPDLVITEKTNSTSIDGYDSFAHINIIVSVEEQFQVKFTTRELGKMNCVGDVIGLLREKGVAGP